MKRIVTLVENGRVVGLVHDLDACDQHIRVNGKEWRFDFDEYGGPLWLRKDGEPRKYQCPNKAVWRRWKGWHKRWRAERAKSQSHNMGANLSPSAGISAGTAAFNPNGASTVSAGETSGAGDGTEVHAGRVGNPLTQRCCPMCQRAFAGRPKKLLPPSALAEYLAGDTVQQVAARHGMTWPTVRRRLMLAGVAIRGKGMRPGTVLAAHKNRKVSVDDTAAIIAAVKAGGRTLASIAAQFGITRQRVGQLAAHR